MRKDARISQCRLDSPLYADERPARTGFFHLPDRRLHRIRLPASEYTTRSTPPPGMLWVDFTPFRREFFVDFLYIDYLCFLIYVSLSVVPALAISEAISYQPIEFTLDNFVLVSNLVLGLLAGHGTLVSAIRIAQIELIAGIWAFAIVIVLHIVPGGIPLALQLPLMLIALHYGLLVIGLMGGYVNGLFDILSIYFSAENIDKWVALAERSTSLGAGCGLLLVFGLLTPLPWHRWQINSRSRRWFRHMFHLGPKIINDNHRNIDRFNTSMRDAQELLGYLDEVILQARIFRAKRTISSLLQTRLGMVLGMRFLDACNDLGRLVQSNTGSRHNASGILRIPVNIVARDIRRRVVPNILLSPFDVASLAELEGQNRQPSLDEQISAHVARIVLLMDSIHQLGLMGDASATAEALEHRGGLVFSSDPDYTKFPAIAPFPSTFCLPPHPGHAPDPCLEAPQEECGSSSYPDLSQAANDDTSVSLHTHSHYQLSQFSHGKSESTDIRAASPTKLGSGWLSCSAAVRSLYEGLYVSASASYQDAPPLSALAASRLALGQGVDRELQHGVFLLPRPPQATQQSTQEDEYPHPRVVRDISHLRPAELGVATSKHERTDVPDLGPVGGPDTLRNAVDGPDLCCSAQKPVLNDNTILLRSPMSPSLSPEGPSSHCDQRKTGVVTSSIPVRSIDFIPSFFALESHNRLIVITSVGGLRVRDNDFDPLEENIE